MRKQQSTLACANVIMPAETKRSDRRPRLRLTSRLQEQLLKKLPGSVLASALAGQARSSMTARALPGQGAESPPQLAPPGTAARRSLLPTLQVSLTAFAVWLCVYVLNSGKFLS